MAIIAVTTGVTAIKLRDKNKMTVSDIMQNQEMVDRDSFFNNEMNSVLTTLSPIQKANKVKPKKIILVQKEITPERKSTKMSIQSEFDIATILSCYAVLIGTFTMLMLADAKLA